ncbi:MAG: hypothetical protein WD648_06815 [Planctomycetaceae bacterium]
MEFPVYLFAAILAFLTCAAADGSEPIVRVEEDWKVEVNVPNPDDHAPQIVNSISPNGSLDGLHAVFELNHSTLPDYTAGGMQLQTWVGETNLEYKNSPGSGLLHHDDETVTYTLSMSVNGGSLTFEVVNGHSDTWGKFGGLGYLKSSVSTDLSNLNSYDSNTSVNKSRVGYASHRVKKFARTKVRLYSADGLVSTDETERVVHVHDSQ